MKSISSRQYLTKFTKCVKSCIALVFGLCSAFSPFLASADDSATLSQIEANTSHLSGIATSQAEIQVVLDQINNRVQTHLPSLAYLSTISGNIADIETLIRNLNIPDYSSTLSTLSSNVAGLKSANHTDLVALKTALQNIHSRQNDQSAIVNTGFVQVSNLLERLIQKSSGGQDVLAGNPWWATNSAFVLTQPRYSLVYPHETPDSAYSYSFPQFLSKWSAMLCYPWSGTSIGSSDIREKWWSYWGRNRYGGGLTGGISTTQPYTWFDWMSDATRSNWVLQATAIDLLAGLSNSPAASSPDYLAGNPWWATNSGFVTDYYRMTRNGAYPPSAYPHDSFPVFASQLAATIYQPNISDYPYSSDYFSRWGRGGANWNNGVYTWFDWVSDYLRSNLVLTTSYTETNLVEELYEAGYDVDQSVTNVPLPQYSLPADESIPEAESALASGQSAINDLIDNLPKPSTGGNAEIVVIPEFSVGGIHVPEYRASLNSSIVPVARSVLSFLYSVGVACFIFTTAKGEYLFYASLGRMWGTHGYDPSAS